MHACIWYLDCDPYNFYVGDGLDPCAFEWSWCVRGDKLEADVNCLDPIHASLPAFNGRPIWFSPGH